MQGVRQALAAIGGIGGERDPAAGGEFVVGLLEARGRAHHAVLEMAALLVAGAVERQQLLGMKAPAASSTLCEQIGRGLLIAGQLGE